MAIYLDPITGKFTSDGEFTVTTFHEDGTVVITQHPKEN